MDIIKHLFSYWSNMCKSKWYIDCSYWLGLMLENKHSITLAADTPSMAHSVEFRSPFLDHRIVELAFSINPFEKVDLLNKQNKMILKKAMLNILPKNILFAKKMGFGYNVPVAQLIRTKWRNEISNMLLKGYIIKSGIFNPSFIKQVLNLHFSGKQNNINLILALYSLEIWWRLYMVEK